MFLLDTNVVSELRRIKPHGAVEAWRKSRADDELFISVMTVYEIQAGIERTRTTDPAKASDLERWLAPLAGGTCVLPATAEIAQVWARLMHRRADHLRADALIAATALVHGLTVATRNGVDFSPFGVSVFDPFTYRA
jgi:predicted nucleic acid-binding protein